MEFDLIEAIRARVDVRRGDVALGIGDDAALLDVPADRQLVACTDTLVAGVHFLPDTAPQDLGWKSLAVNLSDLAAMGAEPAWALLALTLPEADGGFVDHFAEGFAELAGRHGVALVGGDTTQGPLSMTVTTLGTVPRGQALTRGGARAGDAIFVTGTLGDAAGALRVLRDSGLGLRRQDAGANGEAGPKGESQERRVSRDSVCGPVARVIKVRASSRSYSK
jgi:thiamine-monophosphate kinase